MRLLLLLFVGGLLTFNANAQNTIASVGDGNANNPFTWDCICFPTPDDNVTINHDVVMNVDWIISSGGSITVGANGSFIEDANNRTILVDGNGSEFHNHGTTELTNMTFTSGAAGHNHNLMSLDTGLYLGANGSFMNHGTLVHVDSLFSLGTFTNLGSMTAGNVLNSGTWTNSGDIFADSLGNTSTFNSTGGIITCNDFGNTGTVNQTGGDLNVGTNFWNIGDYTLAANSGVHAGNDFFNGDTLGGSATFVNDGLVEVSNDFWNTDQINGSGVFCIASASTNTGNVDGTVDICDNTGVGFFDLNLGTIGGNVTDCISGCSVGIDENGFAQLLVHPNPASSLLILPEGSVQAMIYNLQGQLVLNGTSLDKQLNIEELPAGVYVLRLQDVNQRVAVGRFVKQ